MYGAFLYVGLFLYIHGIPFNKRLMQYVPYVQIREYHRRHPAARVVDANEEHEELLKEEPRIEFTGEVDALSLPLFICCSVCFLG